MGLWASPSLLQIFSLQKEMFFFVVVVVVVDYT